MARNPFEQLQDLVVEPRQAFEEITAMILNSINPKTRRVRVFKGDGGIDSYDGTLGEGGECDVYQIKHFPTAWGDSQKQQIRDSFHTASTSSEYNLRKWTLCVPSRLTKEDLRWFDEWRSKKDYTIELMDGDDLTKLISDPSCYRVRETLRVWKVAGIQGGVPSFRVVGFIQKQNPQQSGLTTTIILRIENKGDLSARGLKIKVSHDETYCISYQPHEGWKQFSPSGALNPRDLLHQHALNPGDHSVVMSIPLCERSILPFCISIRITAEDTAPIEFHSCITSEQITAGLAVTFQSGVIPVALTPISSTLVPPTSPAAIEILDLIRCYEDPTRRGLTEVMGGNPSNPLEAAYIPNTTGQGIPIFLKKSSFRAAINELLQLGWLLPPEGEGKVSYYELKSE